MDNTNPTPFTGRDGAASPEYYAIVSGIDGSGNVDPLKTDGSGKLLTSVTGAGSGGTSATDDAAFTPGTDAGTPMMAVVTADTVDSGDVGVVGMDVNRNLKVSIEADNAGIGGGTQYDDGDSTPATPTGTLQVFDDGGTITAVSATNPLPVSASIDATGLATEAKQDTGNTALAAIETATEAIQAAQLADGHNVTVDNGAGASAVNIQDGGNTITVDGTVAVTNAGLTELAAAINSSKVDVNIVSSDVATGGTSAADDADFTAGTTSGTPAMGVYESSPSSVTDGDLGVAGITEDRRLKTSSIVTSSALPSGAATAANQQTDALTDTELRATPVPVSGTVTAELSATDNAVLDEIESAVDGIETTLGTIDTDTGGIATSTASIDTKTPALGQALAAASTPVVLPAAQITTLTPQTDALTDTQLRATAVPVSATDLDIRALTNTDVVTAELSAVDNAVLDTIDAVLDTIKVDTEAIETAVEAIQAGQLADGHNVTVDNASLAVTGTFWQATQPVSLATVPSHAVTNAGTFPVQVDGSALTALQLIDDTIFTDDAAFTPATSKVQAIGFQADETSTDSVDEGDIGAARMTLDRRVRVANKCIDGPGEPVIDSYTNAPFNLSAGANQVLVSSAANKQIWVYGIGFSVNVAGTVSFQDEDDAAITGVMTFAANGGLTANPSGNFAMPMWKLGTDKDLECDVVTSELDGWITYSIVSV